MLIRLIARTAILALLFVQPLAAQTAPPTEDYPKGSGYFREQDTLPGSYRLYLQQPNHLDWLSSVGPIQERVKKSSFKTDAHEGVANYSPRRQCTECHDNHSRDLHVARMDVRCTQCHRDSPIAGIYHYYSAMNPIRRHAYICAKCHEGATPSFASYVIHEPNPLAPETRESFPALFYATWFMVILAGGVFVFFLPYALLWGFREFISILRRRAKHGS